MKEFVTFVLNWPLVSSPPSVFIDRVRICVGVGKCVVRGHVWAKGQTWFVRLGHLAAPFFLQRPVCTSAGATPL